jgi:poly-gamma-glutamate synthesis protein (capsule biosynthesis protein)
MRLLLVGDVMLGRLMNEVLVREPPEYPWGDTLPILRTADMRVCNLECALADAGQPWSPATKVFHFRSDVKNVAVLRAAGMDAVSLANNHTLDFGYDALGETLRALDADGIARAGAGHDVFEASRPAIVEAHGVRIGILAFTDNEPEWAATAERAGVYHVPVELGDARARALLAAVRAAKAAVDILIVSAHWGPNWGYHPPQAHISFAHALVEAGADVIFGHSGHVLRGVELYRRRPIIYCAGDFVDDYAVDKVERNDVSCIFVVELEEGETQRVRLYPTVIQEFQARVAPPNEAQVISDLMRRLCAERGTPTEWSEAESCLVVRPEGTPTDAT